MGLLSCLILDVDGVLTDGTKFYDKNGQCIYKRYHDHDKTAIKLFLKNHTKVCLLSSDPFNEALAKELKIPFYNSRKEDGTIDKLSKLDTIRHDLLAPGLLAEDITYIGDDVQDFQLMMHLKKNHHKCYCPNDAVPIIKKYFRSLSKNGGEGVVMELYSKGGHDEDFYWDLGEYNY